MLMKLFVLVCFLITQVAVAQAPQSISYEKFLLMSKSEQNQVLINMMEMIVELEQQHIDQKKYSNVRSFNSGHAKKLFSKIRDLILSNAHAEDITERLFYDFANEFNEALKEKDKKDKCIYAGWVSRMKPIWVTENGSKVQKTVCFHPSKLDKTDNLFKSYDKFKNKCKPEEIACQPAVFGFKKEESPICVLTNTNSDIHNASAACMREALDPKDLKLSDSREVRFKKIKEIITEQNGANSKPFTEMYKNIARACICENGLGAIAPNYTTYMQPHQTCFGLLKSLKYIFRQNECYPQDILTSDQATLFEQLKDELIVPSKGVRDPWGQYQQITNNFKNAKFCSDSTIEVDKPDPVINCKAKCKKGTTDPKITGCEIVFTKDEQVIDYVKINGDYKIDEANKELKIDFNIGNAGYFRVCPITLEENTTEPEIKCEAKCVIDAKDSTKNKCTFTVTKNGEVQDKAIIESGYKMDPNSKELPVKFKLDGKDHSKTCSATYNTNNQDDKKLSCSAKCENKEDKKILCSSITILENGAAPKDLTLITNKYEGPAPDNKKIAVDYKIKELKSTISCDVEITNNNNQDDDDYKLTVKEVKTTKTDKTVEALVNGGQVIPADHTINWIRKNTGSLKFDEPKKDNTGVPDGDGTKTTVTTGVVGTEQKITQPRKSSDYDICARLLNKDQTLVGEEKCETIPKLEQSKTPAKGGGRNLPPPPAPGNRGKGTGSSYRNVI